MDYRELREVMKFLHCKGLMPKDIYSDMCETLGDSAPSYAMVKKWVTEFRKGRTSTEDSGRSGRPRDVSTYENVDYIRQLIKDDERITVQDIAKCVGISFGSVHAILSKLLEMVKVSGRWVPRRVSNELKMTRLEFCKEISARYRVYPDRLVHQTVIDDAWIYHFERIEILTQAPGQGGDLDNCDDEQPVTGILNRVLTGELNPKDTLKHLHSIRGVDRNPLPVVKSESKNDEVTSTSVDSKSKTSLSSPEPKSKSNCSDQQKKTKSSSQGIEPDSNVSNSSEVGAVKIEPIETESNSRSDVVNGSKLHTVKVESDKPQSINGSQVQIIKVDSSIPESKPKMETVNNSEVQIIKIESHKPHSANGCDAKEDRKVANGSSSNASVPNILALLSQRPANGSAVPPSPAVPLMGPNSISLGQLSNTQLANMTLLGHLVSNNSTSGATICNVQSGLKRSGPEQSPVKKKLRSNRPPSETSCVFWDSEGVLFVETLEPGKKMAGELYCKMLERLIVELNSKRPGAIERGVLLVEDQSPAGVKPPRGLQLLPLPPNSPDLSPSDFHIFPKVKEHLRGRQGAEEGLMSIVADFFKTHDASFFKYGLSEMERRCTLCADLNGDHVDKYIVAQSAAKVNRNSMKNNEPEPLDCSSENFTTHTYGHPEGRGK